MVWRVMIATKEHSVQHMGPINVNNVRLADMLDLPGLRFVSSVNWVVIMAPLLGPPYALYVTKERLPVVPEVLLACRAMMDPLQIRKKHTYALIAQLEQYLPMITRHVSNVKKDTTPL